MKKVKILYIIDILVGFGGTEKHLYRIVENLDKKKFACYLFAFETNQQMIQLFEKQGCIVLKFSLEKFSSLMSLGTLKKVARFVSKERIDIIQTLHWGADCFGALLAQITNRPVHISSRRDMGCYRNGLYLWTDRVVNKMTHHYHSVCDRVTHSLVQKGVSAAKITKIYNGVDLSLWNGNGYLRKRRELQIANDAFVIGNISHFRPEKGHRVFFEAISSVAEKIPQLQVIALGYQTREQAKTIANMLREFNLSNIVKICYATDVRKYLAVMDVVCLTPICNEGFSNALLEEMAAGKAVVATDVGGNAEAVIDGVSGFIIPPNNVRALERALLRLYSNPSLRKRMGVEARKRIESHFSLDKITKQFENFYLNLLTSKS